MARHLPEGTMVILNENGHARGWGWQFGNSTHGIVERPLPSESGWYVVRWSNGHSNHYPEEALTILGTLFDQHIFKHLDNEWKKRLRLTIKLRRMKQEQRRRKQTKQERTKKLEVSIKEVLQRWEPIAYYDEPDWEEDF